MNYHLDIIVICHFRAHFHIHFHAHFHAHFCTHFCAHFDKVLREYPHFCLVGFLYILITDFTPTYQVPNRARVTSISWLFCGLLGTRIPAFYTDIRTTNGPAGQPIEIRVYHQTARPASGHFHTAAAAATGEASVRIPKASGASYVFQKTLLSSNNGPKISSVKEPLTWPHCTLFWERLKIGQNLSDGFIML